MVRGNRIKEYQFGPLTSSAGGIVDVYSDYPLNGMLHEIVLYGSNYTVTGSMGLFVSGTTDMAFYSVHSGTVNGGVTIPMVKFPRATIVGTNGSPVPDTANQYTQFGINSVIHVIGSGLGAAKSGLGLAIVYQ